MGAKSDNFCLFSAYLGVFCPDLWMKYRIFISIVDISANLENIDIDKAALKISISISIFLKFADISTIPNWTMLTIWAILPSYTCSFWKFVIFFGFFLTIQTMLKNLIDFFKFWDKFLTILTIRTISDNFSIFDNLFIILVIFR